MDAAGRTAAPPGRSPSPFATTAPDPNPASVRVERILKEALRCLKRRLSDAVYRCLLADHRDHACAT
jgi:hypothetical protein